MNKLFVSLMIVFGITGGSFAVLQSYQMGIASAQGAGSAIVSVDAVKGEAPVSRSATLADPTADPVGFVSDLNDAKKRGWLGLVLVGLYGAVRILGFLSKKHKSLLFFAHGNVAIIVAGVGTMLSGAIDALFLGGSMGSIAVAGLFSLIGFIPGWAPVTKKA